MWTNNGQCDTQGALPLALLGAGYCKLADNCEQLTPSALNQPIIGKFYCNRRAIVRKRWKRTCAAAPGMAARSPAASGCPAASLASAAARVLAVCCAAAIASAVAYSTPSASHAACEKTRKEGFKKRV